MYLALGEAQKAYQEDEVPVGCVIVHEGRVIGKGHNRVESLKDPTAHAEILAISAACNHLESWRLTDCTAYCTLEPCAMCTGAFVLSRIERIVFATHDPKFGACGSIFNIAVDDRLNHRILVSSGVLRNECSLIMQEFFKAKRKNQP